jgi:hypothetical protein
MLISCVTDSPRFRLPAFLARNSRIKGLILELRHKSINHRVADPDEVAHIDAEISRWWNEVQDLIDPACLEDGGLDQGQPDGSSNILRSSHRLLLIVQKHESTILLNRPVITSGNNTYAVSAAMQRCIGASKAIISRIYQHLQETMRDGRSQDGRISNPLFWPGFTWSIWMSGLILLYAASNGFYSVDAAQRYDSNCLSHLAHFLTLSRESSRCVKLLDNLSMRRIFWPGACSAAIKDLQQALSQKASSKSLIPSVRQEEHSTSIPSDESVPQSSPLRDQINGTPIINQPPSMNNNISDLPSTTETVPALPSFPEDASFLQDWPGMNGEFLSMESSFTDFDDIFQFMDVPYHLNDLT